tara:strand:+ start:332 stop:511 length:180 start_codon:yes stop_codon:yes gene_type:complete
MKTPLSTTQFKQIAFNLEAFSYDSAMRQIAAMDLDSTQYTTSDCAYLRNWINTYHFKGA